MKFKLLFESKDKHLLELIVKAQTKLEAINIANIKIIELNYDIYGYKLKHIEELKSN